jgi:ABC-type lipoprotein export system ATPase subunit
MAKKEKAIFSFKDMVGSIDGIIKKTPIIRETAKTLSKRVTIPTGIHVLNAALSGSLYGGIPDNRITIIGGVSGSGKSFLCYNIAREAQKKGYSIIYIDTEFAIELDQLPNYGIDISEDRFMLVRSNIIEDLKIFMTQFLDNLKEQKAAGVEPEKIMIVLDSIGQMGSRKEVEDALSGKEKADFTKSKALGSFFRIINSDLGFLSIPLICTNHTYLCVTGETEIMMGDGSVKPIMEIIPGDYVETLVGPKLVNSNTKYDNSPLMEITLETGEVIKCTSNHRFLVKPEWSEKEEDECWKCACDLMPEDIILSIK